MTKAIDLTKFRKDITKNIPGLSVGFRDPKVWISTGNFALNYAISGRFRDGGIPLGKVSILAGQSGSGKSFLASGNITANAQKQDVFVVLIDTENALDEKWLHALDVDTSDEKLLKLNMAMIDEVAKLISDFMKDYKTRYGVLDEAERPRVLFVIDSLGMLMTPTDVNQFEAGDLKGDMGRKPRALGALVRNCVNMFGEYDVGLVCTNHSYASQDMFNPDDVVSGGQGQIFASSIVVATRKLKLKEDEMGNKLTGGEVSGIRAQCKIMKTRFNKPFEQVEIKIPYDRGMDPYSGLYDLFVQKKLLVKEGNKWVYTKLDGTQIKQFEKPWDRNEDGCLEVVMDEFHVRMAKHEVTHVPDKSVDSE
jgi:RecA/RadA recombinase